MYTAVGNISHAIRVLLRSPGYAAATLLSLGLGIGANTALFTVTNATLLHSLPVTDPDRILELFTVDHATQSTIAGLQRSPVSMLNIADIRKQNEVFTGVAAYTQTGLTLTGFGKPTQEFGFAVTNNYFDVLGIHPAAGRWFDAADSELPGAPHPDVVLSYGLAQRLFGSAAAAPGRTIDMNAATWTVIGVAPASFRGTQTVSPPEAVFVPLSMHSLYFAGPAERLLGQRRFRVLQTFARMKPGVTQLQALANLQTIAGRLETAYPSDNRGRGLEVSTLNEAALGFARREQAVGATLALSAAVGFVLLIACANLANLSLARATRRSKEMGVRVAMGASRSHLMRQLLTEAALLAVAGGLLGMGIGWLGARALWAARPGFLTNAQIDLQLDGRVVLFTLALSALSCLLFGVAPMLRASAPDVSRLLNSGGRGNVQGGVGSGLRKLLVVGEIALALVALVGAGLFIRSLQNAQNMNLGFDGNNLIVGNLNLGALQMTPEKGRQFIHDMIAKVHTLPGVVSVAVSDAVPLGVGLLQTAFHEGDPVDAKLGLLTPTPPASPEFFDTKKIPLVEGRIFNDFDQAGTTRVAVVSETFAKRMWPGQRAIGKRFHFATSPELLVQVVGIVKDHTVINIGETPLPVAWMPFDQAYQPFSVLHVRTAGAPEAMLPSVIAAVQSLNANITLVNPGTAQQVISQGLWAPRMAAVLFGIFGLLGTALAVIGVYGVLAYTVAQRTSEIGLRMAIGARPSTVLGMVLGDSMRLAIAGIAIGAAAALAMTRMVANLLFNLPANDPLTFVSVGLILAATALAAGGIPAYRASRIDPVTALREE